MQIGSIGITLIAIVATAAVGCSKAEAPAGGATLEGAHAPGNVAAGKQTYNDSCKKCHGQDGTGSGGLTGGNFVGEKARLAKTDAELIEIIKEGKQGKIGTMPAHKELLTDQQIRDVLAYIRATYGD